MSARRRAQVRNLAFSAGRSSSKNRRAVKSVGPLPPRPVASLRYSRTFSGLDSPRRAPPSEPIVAKPRDNDPRAPLNNTPPPPHLPGIGFALAIPRADGVCRGIIRTRNIEENTGYIRDNDNARESTSANTRSVRVLYRVRIVHFPYTVISILFPFYFARLVYT